MTRIDQKQMTGFDISLLGEQVWPPKTVKVTKSIPDEKMIEEIELYEANMEQDISRPISK